MSTPEINEIAHEQALDAQKGMKASVQSEERLMQYAALKQEMDALDLEIKALGVFIAADLQARGIDKMQSEWGTFSVVEIPRWEYSEAVAHLDDLLKDAREKERIEGIAKKRSTTSLRFQST